MFGHVGGVETKLLFYVQRSTYRYCYSVSRLIRYQFLEELEMGSVQTDAVINTKVLV